MSTWSIGELGNESFVVGDIRPDPKAPLALPSILCKAVAIRLSNQWHVGRKQLLESVKTPNVLICSW